MKTRFKNICKISLFIFVVLILLVAFLVDNVERKTVRVPEILGTFLLIFAISTSVCFIMAFVFDAIESIKKDKILYFVVMVAIIIVIAFVYNYFAHYPSILNCLPSAVIYACAAKAGDYIFRKKE